MGPEAIYSPSPDLEFASHSGSGAVAYGKIDLAKVMDGVKALADDNKVFQNRLLEAVKSLKGKKVSVNSLSTILDNMGIKLTDEELKDLTQNLPVDEAGKIHINNLDNTLERFGIDLTEEELAKLSEDLQIDPNGKVDLKEVMDGVKATTE
ncbi:centrin-1-like [Bos javanicus]|uniref:centrin-1-like n=1 Tax=Bos javanicus TaxID=9906 RepID=UPI002AA802D1|nr:centrin-1-like [Bos javanicus]